MLLTILRFGSLLRNAEKEISHVISWRLRAQRRARARLFEMTALHIEALPLAR